MTGPIFLLGMLLSLELLILILFIKEVRKDGSKN